jgi:hypothetical protein
MLIWSSKQGSSRVHLLVNSLHAQYEALKEQHVR